MHTDYVLQRKAIHTVAEWMKKIRTQTAEWLISTLRTHRDWKWSDRKEILHANRSQKTAGVASLISDKTDIKPKTVTRDFKKRSLYHDKRVVHQEHITIINIYTPVFLHGSLGSPPLLPVVLSGSWSILQWGRSRSKLAWRSDWS